MDDEGRVDGDALDGLGRAILEAARRAGLGVTVTSGDRQSSRRIYANQVAADILGYGVDELVGSATALTFAPEQAERMRELDARWWRGDPLPGLIETVALRKDGVRVPVEVAFHVVPLDGRPVAVAFLRDIRERKAAEEAVRRSEARFRRLIESAPDAIAVMRDDRFAYLNPSAARLFGRSLEEAVDRPIVEMLHAESRAVFAARSSGRHEGEAPLGPQEYRILRPDGRTVDVEIKSIVLDYEGAPAVLGFARDITERKRSAEELFVADRMATLGVLAAGVAHEINNPLTYASLSIAHVVRAIERLAPAGPERDELDEAITAAQDGLARVASIVRDLHSLTSLQTAERWPVDVTAVMNSAINLVGHSMRGHARVVRSYLEVPPLKTDPGRLGQVFVNLLLNAVQAFVAGDEATNEIRVSIDAPDTDHVRVRVQDNGPGIAAENLPRIFEPFFTTKPAGQGTGLGLAICRTTVASLRGQLSVDSILGEGSTFSVIVRTNGEPDGARRSPRA